MLCHAVKPLGGREGAALHALLHPDCGAARGLEELTKGAITGRGSVCSFNIIKYSLCCDERFQDCTDRLI